jgi:uncharacterized protein (DUF4415 family)
MKMDDQKAAELKRLAAMPDDQIDTSDIPERSDWAGAEIGKFYRPIKTQLTLRIDADVVEWFKARGGKYQSAINDALRQYVQAERSNKR